MKQPDRTLIAALDPFMTAHGFKFVKSRNVYIRKTASGFDEFVFSTYPLATGEKWKAGYHEGFYGMGLRSDAVEVIYDALNLTYGDDNKRYRGTVFRSVGSPSVNLPFDPARDRELFLRFDHLEEDVAETAGRIEAMLEADGWSWYARYTDPVALSQGINDPIDLMAGPHPLVNNSGQRPLVGVAAACVGEPQRVGELIAAYMAQALQIDERATEEGRKPFAPKLEQQLGLITEKARELGYPIPA